MASPLFLKNFSEDGLNVKLHVDYLKALLDYEINEALPLFNIEDLNKTVTFFATDETVNLYRPEALNIKLINGVMINGSNVDFDVSLKTPLTSTLEKVEWQNNFESYFDVWIEKFITVYSKYLKAAQSGELEEFTKLN